MVGFFKDHDELYWNVTGNNWDFPIDAVRATVLLPSGARITGHKSFTGERGSTSSTATEHTSAANEITFQNSRPVLPGEGLTIVVTWPKGVVVEPDVSTRVAQQLEANISSLIALLGVLCVLGYFFLAWLLVGRDPAKQTIVPLFAPPKGFSPAAARMVMHMGFDTTCFTAAILSMAVKGFLRIEEQDKTYTLIKTGRNQDRLSHGEKNAAQALFPHGNSLTLKQSQHERIKAGVDTLKNSLKTEYGKAYFHSNRFFFSSASC